MGNRMTQTETANITDLCLADYAGYGACVKRKGHAGTFHQDANGHVFEIPKMTTEAKKTARIQELNRTLGIGEGFTFETAAAEIRKLAGFIRSAKWNDAVEAYADFVETAPTVYKTDSLAWAIGQGSVYFAHAIF